MFIKSNHVFEMKFKTGENDSIIMPKATYSQSEINNGKKTIIEVTNEQLELLKKEKEFSFLVDKGEYVITDVEPAGFRTTSELVVNMKEENNNLKAEIEKLKAEMEAFKKTKKATKEV
jgi:hypothetical protein